MAKREATHWPLTIYITLLMCITGGLTLTSGCAKKSVAQPDPSLTSPTIATTPSVSPFTDLPAPGTAGEHLTTVCDPHGFRVFVLSNDNIFDAHLAVIADASCKRL